MLPRQLLLGCIVYLRRCPYKVLLQHDCPVSWKQRGDKSSLRRKYVAKAKVARLYCLFQEMSIQRVTAASLSSVMETEGR